MALLNTHHYDGQLKERLEELRPELERISRLESSIKLNRFNQLHTTISNPAKRGLNMIISDLNKSPNHDSSNDLNAENILYLCLELYDKLSQKDKSDIFGLLEEQLADITGGSCPPGRATRIFQFYTVVSDVKNDDKDV